MFWPDYYYYYYYHISAPDIQKLSVRRRCVSASLSSHRLFTHHSSILLTVLILTLLWADRNRKTAAALEQNSSSCHAHNDSSGETGARARKRFLSRILFQHLILLETVLYATKLLQTKQTVNIEKSKGSWESKHGFYFERCEMFTELVGTEAEAPVWREQLKMDARRVKLKVSAGFKMRGLILRPYVTVTRYSSYFHLLGLMCSNEC